MSNFTLTLEPMAGSDFKDLVVEAKKKCQDLNLAYIHFTFNRVSVSVGKRADPSKALQQYLDACDKGVTYFIAENI